MPPIDFKSTKRTQYYYIEPTTRNKINISELQSEGRKGMFKCKIEEGKEISLMFTEIRVERLRYFDTLYNNKSI